MSINAYDYGKSDGFDEAIQAVIKLLDGADSACSPWAIALIEEAFVKKNDETI